VDRLSIQTVSALAGHASVTITFNRYGHLLQDYQETAREAMNRRSRGVPSVRPDLPTRIDRKV
jgi:hypothetical protein